MCWDHMSLCKTTPYDKLHVNCSDYKWVTVVHTEHVLIITITFMTDFIFCISKKTSQKTFNQRHKLTDSSLTNQED